MKAFFSGTQNDAQTQIGRISATHTEAFGCRPAVVATAPCRFHLMGEHTWFFGGKTLSMAMDRFVSVSVSPRADSNLHFHMAGSAETKKISLEALRFRKEDKWANSIKSVVFGFLAEGFLRNATPLSQEQEVPAVADDSVPKITGLDFCVACDIQQSAGMGVTTAIKICTACVLNEFFCLECSESELFSAIDRGNTDFLKESGENHFAEHLTAMFSRKNSVLLSDHSFPHLSQSSFSLEEFDFPSKTILLVDSRVPRFSVWNENSLMTAEYRALLDSLKITKGGEWAYNEDRGDLNEVLGNVRESDRRHLYGIIYEHGCVMDARKALSKGNFALFARAVNKSHETMRDLYDISCPEIDWILKRLVEINPTPDRDHNPVCCGRITGQGLARCLYAILDDENIEEFASRLTEYTRIFAFKASALKVRSADGVLVTK